jgi:hypothetical protein
LAVGGCYKYCKAMAEDAEAVGVGLTYGMWA